jgi:UDP-N-acetylglucosamine acyltransferase
MGTRSSVHPSAVIDESLGPVRISDDCEIHAHVVLRGPLILAPGVKVYPGAVIGYEAEVYPPEWSGEQRKIPTFQGIPIEQTHIIEIGRETIIRENVVIQRTNDTVVYSQPTIGERCYLMEGCHIAHDCIVEDDVTIAPKVVLAGHCRVMWRAYLGIASSFHQRTVIGSVAMVGMGAVVVRDVEPGAKVIGVPARPIGANLLGLERAGLVDQAEFPELTGQWSFRPNSGAPWLRGTKMAEERKRWKSICAQRALKVLPDISTPAS